MHLAKYSSVQPRERRSRTASSPKRDSGEGVGRSEKEAREEEEVEEERSDSPTMEAVREARTPRALRGIGGR
jgi:hypothetical protein